jgi:hypothetical protein
MQSQEQNNKAGCGCGCSKTASRTNAFLPKRLEKAFTLSMDPALIMLVLGQSYVMTQAQKHQDNQFWYVATGSLINLVLFNLSSIDYDAF